MRILFGRNKILVGSRIKNSAGGNWRRSALKKNKEEAQRDTASSNYWISSVQYHCRSLCEIFFYS
jgi:hypothetical protein